jgi:hypothetical protein
MIDKRILDFEPLQFEQWAWPLLRKLIQLKSIHKLCRFCNGNL